MDRQQLEEFIVKTYGVEPDYPWMKYPSFAVFRHADNNKWFAVIMTINRSALNLDGDGLVDVVNLKCDPNFAPLLWEEAGIFPAYHMNKSHWITVALDGSVEQDNLKFFLEMSAKLTGKKNRK